MIFKSLYESDTSIIEHWTANISESEHLIDDVACFLSQLGIENPPNYNLRSCVLRISGSLFRWCGSHGGAFLT
jgi:hypothetical protein